MRTQVLVVGAGPVGLTTALLLASAGVDVEVVDAGAGPVTQSRATDLHSATLEALRPSGLTDLLLPLGRPTHRVAVHSPAGPLGGYRTDLVRSPYPYILTVPQCATEGALDDRLAAVGRRARRGTRIDRLTWHADGATAVTGAGETIHARWVVGCDGFGSRVRAEAGIAYRGTTYRHRYVLADLRADCALDADTLHMVLARAGLVAVLPMHLAGWRRVLVQLPPGRPEPDADPVSGLLHHAEQRGVSLRVTDVRWHSAFRIHRRLAGTFRRGPALLAGDAAHACSPIGGQGLNLGLRDAVTLAEVLAGVVHGLAPDRHLDAWAARRRARARQVLGWTDLATRGTTVRSRPGRWLRDTGMAAALGTTAGRRLLAGTVAGR
ncbi:NAD(P)/FAD-dependent oxidoreductase [Actinoplanes sp. NPDC049548]|uniref:FAD-dependent oxidoreductase n=1 Tax=Actinoplanes sp. NPDC049548 TaxID=3155152 RepID=UPI00341FF0FF